MLCVGSQGLPDFDGPQIDPRRENLCKKKKKKSQRALGTPCGLPPSSGLRKEMKVAASTWVLPPQLGRELGLPSQSPVSALWLDTRTVDSKNTATPHYTTPCQTLQLWWPFSGKGWLCTAKILLTVHNRKLRSREGCGQGGSREPPTLRVGRAVTFGTPVEI